MPLMSWTEYNKREDWDIPYTIKIEYKDNLLYYFGEGHSFDHLHPQWEKEKTFWNSFLDKTKNKKRIVFIEGGVRLVEQGEEEAILKHGGMGLATYQANKENIETYSPEPPEKYERSLLEEKFSRELIQYYYFIRVVLQWQSKIEPKPDFEKYMNGYLTRDKVESGWNDFDFSLENMKKIHLEMYKKEFDKNDRNLSYASSNPYNIMREPINEIALKCTIIRDEYIVKKIVEYINNGYSIFAIYGQSHPIVQEPLLKELLG